LLKEMVRVEDIVSRWGGEEFIILLPDTSLEAATKLADRIRLILEKQSSSAAPLAITASFGVAGLQEGESEDDLIRRVDDALYAAKRGGRNRVVAA
jgi:diguanylate cyclase